MRAPLASWVTYIGASCALAAVAKTSAAAAAVTARNFFINVLLNFGFRWTRRRTRVRHSCPQAAHGGPRPENVVNAPSLPTPAQINVRSSRHLPGTKGGVGFAGPAEARDVRSAHQQVKPPSASTIDPVIRLAASEAR